MSSETDQDMFHHLEIWVKHKKNHSLKNWFSTESIVVHIMKHWMLGTISAFAPWSLQSRNHHPLSPEYIILISPVWECYSCLLYFSWWSQCPNMKIRISILLYSKILCVHKSMTFRWCEVSFASPCPKISSSESHKLFRQNTETSLAEHLSYGI